MKLLSNLSLIFLILFFTSCEIKEEITFNQDGSGEVFFNYNMNKLLEEFDSQSNSKKEPQKPIDTIIDFNQLLKDPKFKDSLANLSPEKREVLNSLKDMKMKMSIDETAKKMEFGFGFSFKHIDSLKNMFEKIQKAQKLSGKKDQTKMVSDKSFYKGLSGTNQELSYAYNGKLFTRTVKLKKMDTKEKQKKTDTDLTGNTKIDALFDNLKYTIVIHFPKKIKKVNAKNAVYSKDRKTVTISYGLDTYLKNPEKLSLQIKLAK